MVKGGYKVVNFKDENITAENGATVSGVYESLENNYHKALMISGVVIDGTEYNDTFVEVTVSGSDYTFTAYGKTFTVTSEDKVTVA